MGMLLHVGIVFVLVAMAAFGGLVASAVEGDVYEQLGQLLDGDGDGWVSEADLLTRVLESPPATFSTAELAAARRILARAGGCDGPVGAPCSVAAVVARMRTAIPGEPILSAIPEQVHLAINGTGDVVHVYWITNAETDASTVWWGATRDALTHTAAGSSWTYDAGLLGWSGRVHHALIAGVAAMDRIFYAVGSSPQVRSETFFFRSPVAAQRDFPLHIALYGDMGTYVPMGYAVAEQIVSDMLSTPFDLVHHLGDVAYAGVNSDGELEFVWDVWGRQMQPISSSMPYQFAVGNHERYNDFAAFRNRFLTETNGNGSFYYSYNYGPVHFISMCTEDYVVPYQQGSPQYAWLEADLARADANRAAVPWIVLTGHRPMYSNDLAQDSGDLTQVIEPLMVRYGVDVYLSGHMHEVTLTYPVSGGKAVMDGVEHVGPGAWRYSNARAPFHYVIGTSGAMIEEHFPEVQPDWVAWCNGTLWESPYGYSVLQVANSTHLHFDFRLESNGHQPIDLWVVKDV